MSSIFVSVFSYLFRSILQYDLHNRMQNIRFWSQLIPIQHRGCVLKIRKWYMIIYFLSKRILNSQNNIILNPFIISFIVFIFRFYFICLLLYFYIFLFFIIFIYSYLLFLFIFKFFFHKSPFFYDQFLPS